MPLHLHSVVCSLGRWGEGMGCNQFVKEFATQKVKKEKMEENSMILLGGLGIVQFCFYVYFTGIGLI